MIEEVNEIFLFCFKKSLDFKFVHNYEYYKVKTNMDKSTEIFPPPSSSNYNLYMRTCNAERQKRSAKGSNFKEDERALRFYVVLLFA